MQSLNRRQWLRTAGLAGAFSLTGGINTLANAEAVVRRLHPKQTGPIRLSSNENPFGPSQKVRQAMTDAFDLACRYPWSWVRELTDMIARREGVTPDHIIITAGSTEGLKITGMAYSWQGGEIVAADPTFQTLLTYSENFGAYVHRVPLDDDLQHDLDGMEKRITANTRLVFVCNPNNPTGTLLPATRMRDFCESVSKKTVVFSDEAYFDYVEERGYPSMVELVKAGLNVIVSRTFSKVYGLAGVRVGYLISRPDIIDRLNRHVVANTNILGIYAAKAALEDKEFYQYSLKKNAESRQIIYNTLDAMSLPYVRSHANFVFFKSGRDISGLMGAMKKENVMIGRPFPPLTDWCRISTGTIEDTEIFCEALMKVLG